MNISSLLNPSHESWVDAASLASSTGSNYNSSTFTTPDPTSPPSRSKITKGPGKAKPMGTITSNPRYMPFDGTLTSPKYQDVDIEKRLAEHGIPPLGSIAESSRTIPYSSEKKDFFGMTGREALEVYQYAFKVPGSEREYTVMWDFNIGLVRMTPFFKCLGYSKTMPAKMLDSNEGLRTVCPSITGGSIAAQGYWMPFEAARAVCATFCYEIRWALLPLFGPSFPDSCVSKSDPAFGDWRIDSRIIQNCIAEMKAMKEGRSFHRLGSAERHTIHLKTLTPARAQTPHADDRIAVSKRKGTPKKKPKHRIEETQSAFTSPKSSPWSPTCPMRAHIKQLEVDNAISSDLSLPPLFIPHTSSSSDAVQSWAAINIRKRARSVSPPVSPKSLTPKKRSIDECLDQKPTMRSIRSSKKIHQNYQGSEQKDKQPADGEPRAQNHPPGESGADPESSTESRTPIAPKTKKQDGGGAEHETSTIEQPTRLFTSKEAHAAEALLQMGKFSKTCDRP